MCAGASKSVSMTESSRLFVVRCVLIQKDIFLAVYFWIPKRENVNITRLKDIPLKQVRHFS